MDVVELSIAARPRPIGDFTVDRVLPSAMRRMVGPFAFLDHFGPIALARGTGMDVRPHPHIGLATVTVLFDGEILHRDSLGSKQVIRAGAVNWMNAGRGIVHSERSPDPARAAGPHLHGLQIWVALPAEREDEAPSFSHHAAESLPTLDDRGVRITLLAGSAFGRAAPVPVASPLLLADLRLEPGSGVEVPSDHDERAVYVVKGAVRCGSTAVRERTMAVVRRGADAIVASDGPAHVVILGGASLGPRYVWWNFVSSTPDRIEEAALAWKERRFPVVPGDEVEFIPLHDAPHLRPPAA